MTHEEIQSIAAANNLGQVNFQFNLSKNTGKEFEVGYIFQNGYQTLFCKRQPNTSPDMFYLCNEFEELAKKESSDDWDFDFFNGEARYHFGGINYVIDISNDQFSLSTDDGQKRNSIQVPLSVVVKLLNGN